MKKHSLVAGIDVGTTKICSTIAQIDNGEIRILGNGWSPSRGLKKGTVINLSWTIDSIKASLEQAEKQSDTVFESAFVSIGGAYLQSINCSGKADVRGKNGEIIVEDIERAITNAQSFELPEDYEIIHVLTQNFNLDGQEGVVNPLGMNGRWLSVNLHIVLNASAIVQNIVNAVNKAGVIVNGVVMQQLASAEATLSPDEKELGTIVVDIGGGTTDIVVYSQGGIWHSETLPMGGNLITKDIAIGLKAPLDEAEQLKKETGSMFPESAAEEELIEVEEVGTGRRRTLPRRLLCGIVQARCDEILHAVAEVIRKVGVQSDLITGIVLTGGGSLLDGLPERAEQILNMPVRLGYPINLVSNRDEVFHPAYCTALGLLKYGREIQSDGLSYDKQKNKGIREQKKTEWLKDWIFERIG